VTRLSYFERYVLENHPDDWYAKYLLRLRDATDGEDQTSKEFVVRFGD
jgi:hypothetical protein